MPSAPHIEHHFTASDTVRDVVIGMSDGLTVPFALAAGLSGAKVGTSVVVLAGLAEIAAGSIAMGLGGFLAARTDQEHYQSELEREVRESREIPVEEAAEVARVFEGWGLSARQIEPIVAAITSDEKRETLLRTLDELFATGLRDDWVARLRAADIVAAPINTLLEASNDPDVVANGYVTEIDYPKYGKRLKVHGSPWHFSETPACIGIAPELGADSDEILAGLGYTPAQIEGLRERGIT